MADENIEPYIIATPSTNNPNYYPEKMIWIEKYFGLDFTERLIIACDKSLLLGDVLIDDKMSGHGQEQFNGRKFHFGSNDYLHWNSVMKRLNELIQSR